MYVLPFELFSLVSVQSNVVWAYFFFNYNICTQRRWKRQKLRYEIFMLLPQWHIERWHDVKYVTKHLSCAISVILPSWRAQKGEGEAEGRLLRRLQSIPKWPPPPHPHLPRPVICQQCSMGPEATQQRVVRGGSAPRGQVLPLIPGRGTPLQTLFGLCRSL